MSTRLIEGQLDLAGAPALTEAERRERWLAEGIDFIRLGARGVTVHADALHRFLNDPPHPNLWGTLFRRAAADGLIEPAGFKESSTPSRRGGVQRVWVRT